MQEFNVGDIVDPETLPLKLDFDSEFPAYGGVDPDKFVATFPWGNDIIINGEKQGYPDSFELLPSGHEHIFMDGDELVLQCTPTCWMDTEAVHNQPYTSALISTEGKYAFYRGMVTVNAKMPKGLGAFPAPLWALIKDQKGIAIPEWDIIEGLGHTGKVIYQTAHSNTNMSIFGSNKVKEAQRQIIEPVLGGTDYTDDFHEYSGIWTEAFLYWLIDGKVTFKVHTPLDFNHGKFVEKFLLCNLAYQSGWSLSQPQYDLKYAPDGLEFPPCKFPLQLRVKHIKAYAFTDNEQYRYPTPVSHTLPLEK